MKTVWNAFRKKSVTSFELDKAKTAIEQFIYSCSHTLRAPLKSIAGLVFLLKNSDSIPESNTGEYLQSIERTVGKMETLLNELEQFLINSRHDIVADRVEAKSLVEDVLNDFKNQIESGNIKLKLNVQQTAVLYTDATRLRVVLSHIIANAVMFQAPGNRNKKIRISVTVSQGACKISVRDNGIGIDNEILPRICDLFFRGSQQSSGSGIGLYVVSEMVKKMGGLLSIRSIPESGTNVVVTFPNLTV